MTYWALFSSSVVCKLGNGGWQSSCRNRSTSAFATAYSLSVSCVILVRSSVHLQKRLMKSKNRQKEGKYRTRGSFEFPSFQPVISLSITETQYDMDAREPYLDLRWSKTTSFFGRAYRTWINSPGEDSPATEFVHSPIFKKKFSTLMSIYWWKGFIIRTYSSAL